MRMRIIDVQPFILPSYHSSLLPHLQHQHQRCGNGASEASSLGSAAATASPAGGLRRRHASVGHITSGKMATSWKQLITATMIFAMVYSIVTPTYVEAYCRQDAGTQPNLHLSSLPQRLHPHTKHASILTHVMLNDEIDCHNRGSCDVVVNASSSLYSCSCTAYTTFEGDRVAVCPPSFVSLTV
jgi:hypothetical protein